MKISLYEVDRSWNLLQGQARNKMEGLDIEKWKQCLERFIEQQKEVIKVVSVYNLRIGSAGSDAINLLFGSELDLGNGPTRQEYVVRFASSFPVENEFGILKGLYRGGAKVAKPFWIDEKGETLPQAGYIMGFLNGQAPMQSYFTKGPLAEASPEDREAMMRDSIRCLAAFHAVDPKSSGLEFLSDNAKESDYFEIKMDFYVNILQEFDPKGLERLKPTIKWLKKNKPKQEEAVVCHGDANLSNFMFLGREVTGIIDIATTFLGPREIDLAEFCIPNTLLAIGLDETDGVLSEESLIEEYKKVSGYDEVRHWEFYRIFELFRLALVMCWFRAKASTEVIEDTKAVSMYWENMLLERMRHLL